MTKLNIDIPVYPRPVLVSMPDRRFRKLSDTVQPCLAVVKADFHSLYFVTTAIVSIPCDTICVAFLDVGELNALAMSRLGDDRVEVLLIACCIWVTEERLGKLSIFLCNKGGL